MTSEPEGKAVQPTGSYKLESTLSPVEGNCQPGNVGTDKIGLELSGHPRRGGRRLGKSHGLCENETSVEICSSDLAVPTGFRHHHTGRQLGVGHHPAGSRNAHLHDDSAHYPGRNRSGHRRHLGLGTPGRLAPGRDRPGGPEPSSVPKTGDNRGRACRIRGFKRVRSNRHGVLTWPSRKAKARKAQNHHEASGQTKSS